MLAFMLISCTETSTSSVVETHSNSSIQQNRDQENRSQNTGGLPEYTLNLQPPKEDPINLDLEQKTQVSLPQKMRGPIHRTSPKQSNCQRQISARSKNFLMIAL